MEGAFGKLCEVHLILPTVVYGEKKATSVVESVLLSVHNKTTFELHRLLRWTSFSLDDLALTEHDRKGYLFKRRCTSNKILTHRKWIEEPLPRYDLRWIAAHSPTHYRTSRGPSNSGQIMQTECNKFLANPLTSSVRMSESRTPPLWS